MTVNSFYKSCLLTKVHERQLSRVGIYNNIVSVGDAVDEILTGNLKSDFWEFQEQECSNTLTMHFVKGTHPY